VVDRPKVEQLLSRLGRYAGVLRALGDGSRGAFLADEDKVGNAKYHFVVAIECCIDIANHLIASEGYRMPASNADSFTVLAEEGVLAPEAEARYRAMARFRNRLVHLYWDVDDEAVHGALQEGPTDLDRFAAAVGAWMARHG
jgi:uncharacterized protein YutE (UPF0331/DUF86 family)